MQSPKSRSTPNRSRFRPDRATEPRLPGILGPRVKLTVRLLAVVLSVLPAAGCLLLDKDLDREAADVIKAACSFDILEAYRCEGYESSYEVRGMCKGHEAVAAGIYLFEGSLTWSAENGKVAEAYTVEPIPITANDIGPGEIHFTATCDAEPYRAGSTANCSDASFNTTISKVPMPLLELVQGANPVSVGQFSEVDLAEFPLQQNCKPAAERPHHRPPLSPPECDGERSPALLVTSPEANEAFDFAQVDSLMLVYEAIRLRFASVEIEWQKLEGRFIPVDGLPNLVPAADFPLSIALTDGPGSAGDGGYRVRVRPHDEACPRLWSFWQEFRTVGGGPLLATRKSGSTGE